MNAYRIALPLFAWLVTANLSAANPNDAESQTTVDGRVSVAANQPEGDLKRMFLQGIALPSRDATLRPLAPGTVQAIHVAEGQAVKAGQALVTLDNRAAKATVEVARIAAQSEAAVLQAELAMRAAQSQLARTEIALRAGASSDVELLIKQNEYEQSVATYEQQVELRKQAQAELTRAQVELERLTLRAPFDGTVVQISAKLGNSIDISEPAVRVADLNTLSVEMHLPLQYFGKIQSQEVYVLNASAPVDKSIPAIAKFVSPIVEPTSNTFRVKFVARNIDGSLPAGFEVWFQPGFESTTESSLTGSSSERSHPSSERSHPVSYQSR
ncbi:MAG: efflux RND transporter periplasmic adaptor subunit [Planctomycetota bacterium]